MHKNNESDTIDVSLYLLDQLHGSKLHHLYCIQARYVVTEKKRETILLLGENSQLLT